MSKKPVMNPKIAQLKLFVVIHFFLANKKNKTTLISVVTNSNFFQGALL